jgi:hypothetical protein
MSVGPCGLNCSDMPSQVCILSQKDDLVVQALSVDSLGSGIKVTAELTAGV